LVDSWGFNGCFAAVVVNVV